MRGIYLVQYFPPEKASGLQLVEDLLEGFAKRGWYINLYTPTPTRGVTVDQRKLYVNGQIEEKYDGKVIIHRMRLYREGTNPIARAIRYVIFGIQCFWKAVTVSADFIFTGSGPPTQGVIVGLAKKFSKKKVIYNLQDIFPDSLVNAGVCREDSIVMKIGRKMENYTYRNADVIITISNDMKENIVNKGVNPDKVEVVCNWIDVDKIRPVDEMQNKLFDEFSLSRDKFKVVYAGNLGKVQGVEVIIDAAELLKNIKNIYFIIFGNGSEEEKIKQKISEKGLMNISVFPLQPVERVSEVYSLGNVSIIPCKPGSGIAGMPSKTWSIMAAGSAIIGSFDVGSELDKTLRKAECGYCVEAGNAKALSDAILEMSRDCSAVRKMGEKAREYAVVNVSKEKALDKYIKIMEKSING